MTNNSKAKFFGLKNLILGTPFESLFRFVFKLFRAFLFSRKVIESKRILKYFLNDFLDYFQIRHGINTPIERQLKKIISRTTKKTISELQEINNKQGRLLIATSYGFTPYMLAIEANIALLSKFDGLQPYFLMCDEALPACEWNRWGNLNPDPGIHRPTGLWKDLHNCTVCKEGFDSVINNLPFPIIKLKKYLKDIDLDSLHKLSKDIPPNEYFSFLYKGIKVGKDAFASTTRTLEMGVLDMNDEKTLWIYHRYFFSGLLLVELFEKLFQDNKPDHIFAVHGVYITHGILGQVARKHNINISFWDGPWHYPTNAHQIKIEKDYAPVISLRNKYQNGLFFEFNKEIDRKISSFINEKRSNASIHHGVKNPISEINKVIEHVNIDTSKTVVSVFTNVTHDASTFFPSKLFNDMIDWLFFLIDFYKDSSSTQLIIRAHPSESTGIGTKQPTINEIKNIYSDLPEHIKLINADSDISTYTLIDLSDLVLSYASTVGLDATLIGKPSIIVAKSWYSSIPVFYPKSINEYIEMLNNYRKLKITETMRRNAVSIAFDYHFASKISFPLVSIKSHIDSDGLKLNYKNFDDLYSNKFLDLKTMILNKITK